MSNQAKTGVPLGLRYFEDVLAVELGVIAHRRSQRPRGLRQDPVQPNPPAELGQEAAAAVPATASGQAANRRAPPDREKLFSRARAVAAAVAKGQKAPAREPADPVVPNEAKQRPLPMPCDATGLALSGGGVRSAAIGLGVLQALEQVHNATAIPDAFKRVRPTVPTIHPRKSPNQPSWPSSEVTSGECRLRPGILGSVIAITARGELR